jgi:(2Fe-2S) ferredoxin
MGKKYLTISEFNLEGEFLGFVGNAPGKIKSLRLAILSKNLKIKVPKSLRVSIDLSLEYNDKISVTGISKVNIKTGKIKYKAYGMTLIDNICPRQKKLSPGKAKILVCEKSGCSKRGNKSLLSELEKTLDERNLQDHVKIHRTGCQKRCHTAPDCTLHLGKKKYNKINPQAIASLLEHHLQDCE